MIIVRIEHSFCRRVGSFPCNPFQGFAWSFFWVVYQASSLYCLCLVNFYIRFNMFYLYLWSICPYCPPLAWDINLLFFIGKENYQMLIFMEISIIIIRLVLFEIAAFSYHLSTIEYYSVIQQWTFVEHHSERDVFRSLTYKFMIREDEERKIWSSCFHSCSFEMACFGKHIPPSGIMYRKQT